MCLRIAFFLGLRVLALNILGRFLSSREQNLKYVALETLHQLLRTDSAAVTRHREMLLDCLKVRASTISQRTAEEGGRRDGKEQQQSCDGHLRQQKQQEKAGCA